MGATKDNRIVGRLREQKILLEALKSKKSEFLAIYGRRRVGKTYLIRNLFINEPCIFFHSSGIQNAKLATQLEEFAKQTGSTFYGGAQIVPRESWLSALEELTRAISQVSRRKKVVIFLDELPWLATKRSRLLEALDYYWNRYWVHDGRIKLIVCGSASSWIIDNIINNKGGLYNRVTRTIRLEPFCLNEAKAFLASLGVKLINQQILELYMIFGGIPHYLSLIRKGLSASQNIDELCFSKDGALIDEFDRLFASLFQDSENHLNLIKTIAKHRYGLGQAELIRESKESEGGTTAHRLKELEESGFILSFVPHGHQSKGKYYKIIDEFTLFYLQWMHSYHSSIRKQDQSTGQWLSISQSPSWKSWSGYAFEAVCYKHISQIRKALGITIDAEVGTWRHNARHNKDDIGAQIDLLFDRADGVINICEIKHSIKPFIIDKAYATNLLNKVEVYRKHSKTDKQIFISMIASSGLKTSIYSEELISSSAKLDDLFRSA